MAEVTQEDVGYAAEEYTKLFGANKNLYRIMPSLIHQIVFTKKEIEEESGVSRNTVSTLIDGNESEDNKNPHYVNIVDMNDVKFFTQSKK